MLSKFGAVRTRNAKQEMVYCLPAELGVPTAGSPLKNLVLDVDHNQAMIVVRTSGRGAVNCQAVGLHRQARRYSGTIAGDDTIFICPSSIKTIDETLETVKSLFNYTD